MQLLTKKLPKTHNIILAGDLHCGALSAHWNGWRKMLKRLENEANTFVVLMGDLVEAIAVDDPRFNIEVSDTTKVIPLDQMDYVISDLHPIKEKILYILTGNHELKLARIANLTQHCCKQLFNRHRDDTKWQLYYGAYATKMTAKATRKPMYKLYTTHGRKTVNSTADDPLRRETNMKLQLKRVLNRKSGDCVVMAMGHSHKLLIAQPTTELYMTDDGEEVKARYTAAQQHGAHIDPNLRWYVNTGSFLKNSVTGIGITYSEAFGYDPVEIGYPEIVVENGIVTDVKKTVL